MSTFATLDQLKQHLDITNGDSDGELVDMLDAASEVVASLAGSFDAASVTENLPVVSGQVILSRSPSGPVVVTDPDGTVLTGYRTSERAGLLYGVGTYWPWVSVSYAVAAAAVPASVQLATLIIAAHLWETQRGPAATSPLAADSDSGFPSSPGLGFAIPNRAKELLEPFVRSSQIA